MPIIKSSKKAVKVIDKKTKRNQLFTSQSKNSIKKLEKAIAEKNNDLAAKGLKTAVKNIDTAYSKGLVKKNTRDRQKARLTKKVKEMSK